MQDLSGKFSSLLQFDRSSSAPSRATDLVGRLQSLGEPDLETARAHAASLYFTESDGLSVFAKRSSNSFADEAAGSFHIFRIRSAIAQRELVARRRFHACAIRLKPSVTLAIHISVVFAAIELPRRQKCAVDRLIFFFIFVHFFGEHVAHKATDACAHEHGHHLSKAAAGTLRLCTSCV